jgi:hypothetical protein
MLPCGYDYEACFAIDECGCCARWEFADCEFLHLLCAPCKSQRGGLPHASIQARVTQRLLPRMLRMRRGFMLSCECPTLRLMSLAVVLAGILLCANVYMYSEKSM